jgi:hypothetical protein
MNEWRIGKDLEGNGRGLILRCYPYICLEGLKKATKTLSQVAGLLAEAWTRNLPNTKQEC